MKRWAGPLWLFTKIYIIIFSICYLLTVQSYTLELSWIGFLKFLTICEHALLPALIFATVIFLIIKFIASFGEKHLEHPKNRPAEDGFIQIR